MPTSTSGCTSTLWIDVFAQAAGFLVLVAGTLVYAQGDRKQDAQDKHEHDGPIQVSLVVLAPAS